MTIIIWLSHAMGILTSWQIFLDLISRDSPGNGWNPLYGAPNMKNPPSINNDSPFRMWILIGKVIKIP